MNDYTDRGFVDKVLDAGLKEYSRVTPPANFAVRRPRAKFAWGWLLVPAAAAVAMVVMMRPAPLPSAPARVVAVMEVPALPKPKPVLASYHPHARYHTLTAVEIARLEIPAELLAPRQETPITDLVIKPLESANPSETEKE
jgi:hypothetical protein